jgi:hypothetical protein
MDFAGAVITPHAALQMIKRQIARERLKAILAKPDEVRNVRPGRVVLHGLDGQRLLRVFVDVDRDPPAVVTVYRTSQVKKYWRKP